MSDIDIAAVAYITIVTLMVLKFHHALKRLPVKRLDDDIEHERSIQQEIEDADDYYQKGLTRPPRGAGPPATLQAAVRKAEGAPWYACPICGGTHFCARLPLPCDRPWFTCSICGERHYCDEEGCLKGGRA